MNDAVSAFELLFKYPAVMFRQGSVELSASWPLYVAAVAGLALLIPTLLRYRRVRGQSTIWDRTALAILRTATMALVLLSLFHPVLVVSTSLAEEGVVGILLDDSRSMRIKDDGDTPRSQFIRRAFNPEQGELYAALGEKFRPRLFRFATGAEPVDDPGGLSFSGGRTDLAQALKGAREELARLPLAALVLVSDGAHQGDGAVEDALSPLRAGGIAVHTIGLGRENYVQDIALDRVNPPREVLKGTAISLTVNVNHRGYPGRRVPLIVEDDGLVVDTYEFDLGADVESTPVKVRFTLRDSGLRRLRFRVPVQAGETIAPNNAREALVHVRDRKERILYLEGSPRFELKFLRRAVAEDDNLAVVGLLRTAENKFYRLGLDSPEELVDGFPDKPEALFKYRALILGNIEASFFSPEQMRMIAEFVNRRGGGVLFLGGENAFARGGYGQTPLADLLPVVVAAKSEGDAGELVNVRPTAAGLIHPLLRIAKTDTMSAERWSSLPAVTIVNPIWKAKPGAITLLEAQAGAAADPMVALAVQRYGRGRTAAFAVRDSWRWQMHPDIALEDQSHENLWRQMLRWLVQSVPERLTVSATEAVVPGESVSVSARVHMPTYLPSSDAAVELSVVSPTGERTELAMDSHSEHEGEYQTRFTAREQGLYELRVEASVGEDVLRAENYVQASNDVFEYHDSELNSTLLKRIADETGGSFYTPDTVDSLADNIQPANAGATVVERLALWNMPVIFLLIIGLACVEWGLRRWRGLV